MTSKRKVFLIDPYAIVRSGLRALISAEATLSVVGEAVCGCDLLPLLAQRQPAVVVMDPFCSPEREATTEYFELLRQLRKQHPAINVLIFTDCQHEQAICHAIEAGAIGYLPKKSSSGEVVAAVNAVARGEPALHPIAQSALIQLAVNKLTPVPALTAREQEILHLIAQGKRNRDIANSLYLTEGTVKGYVSAILTKLEVDDRTQAAMFAVKHRIVPNL